MPIPYKEIAEGKIEIEVDGLPEGVGLKNPSSYGLETLKKIIGSPTITFKIRHVTKDCLILMTLQYNIA